MLPGLIYISDDGYVAGVVWMIVLQITAIYLPPIRIALAGGVTWPKSYSVV